MPRSGYDLNGEWDILTSVVVYVKVGLNSFSQMQLEAHTNKLCAAGKAPA